MRKKIQNTRSSKRTNVQKAASSAVAVKRHNAISQKGRALQNKLKIFSVRSGLDLPLFFITLILLVIGLIMLFSASAPNAYYFKNGDSYYFIRSQLIWAVLGVVAMIAISYFDYHHLHKLAVPILIVSFLLLILV